MKYLEDPNLIKLRFRNGMLILPFVRYELMCHLNKNGSEYLTKKSVKVSIITKLFRLLINFPKFFFPRKTILYLV